MTVYYSIKPSNPFVQLFATALALRILFFVLMLNQIDAVDLPSICPDAIDYTESAQAIGSGFDFQSKGVLLFGPGYPAFLALLAYLLYLPPAGVILIQIILSSFGAVLLAKLAHALTDNLRVSLVAGYLNAVSLTSISLANIMLSETLFWVLLCGGLYLAVTGLRNKAFGRLTYAGIIFTLLPAIRSVGQHVWIILVVLVLLYLWPTKKKGSRPFLIGMGVAVSVAVVMLLVSSLRATYNERMYGVPYQALAQPGGMAQVVRLTQSRIEGITYAEASARFDSVVTTRTVDSADYFREFTRYTEERFWCLTKQHPLTVASAVFDNIMANSNGDDRIHHTLLPNTKRLSLGVFNRMHKWGLQYRTNLLAVIGLVMLLYAGRYRPAALIALLYLYFAASTGFSVWQGIRVFYPGQIATAILSAYPLVAAFVWGWARLKRPD